MFMYVCIFVFLHVCTSIYLDSVCVWIYMYAFIFVYVYVLTCLYFPYYVCLVTGNVFLKVIMPSSLDAMRAQCVLMHVYCHVCVPLRAQSGEDVRLREMGLPLS